MNSPFVGADVFARRRPVTEEEPGCSSGDSVTLRLVRLNREATGAPEVGQALSVDVSGISDEDGFDDAVFAYQWLATSTRSAA